MALGIWLAMVIAAPAGAVTIDTQTRTVTAARLSMAFGAVGPDVVREVQWRNSAGTQGANLVENSATATCATKPLSDPANFWGESYGAGSEDPKLVFDGSAGTWTSPAPNQVQTSTEYPTSCSTYTTAVPVTSTYTYYDEAPAANEIMIQRTWRFDLAMNPPLGNSTAFRAYVPQLPLAKYGQVLFPNNGALQAINATQCSKAACLQAFSDGWFAINDATAGDQGFGSGVIVLRDASDTASAQLAIQSLEAGAAKPEPVSNLTSVALQIPANGLSSSLSETEYLCFYDATSWPQPQREALKLPAGCGPVPVPGPGPTANEGGGTTVVPPSGNAPPGGTPGPPPPAPVLGHRFNVEPGGGVVLIELPDTHTFIPLTEAVQLPFGSIIDATHGTVSVTTAGPHGGTQTGQFFDGKFVLTQGRGGEVVATLTGGDFSVCPTARERRHLAHASSHASGRHVVRKLWANAHGKFSTKGNYAAGAVQGTEWLTEDLCEGTLIRVTRDRVAVRNLVNHRHLTVKAGHRYLAKAP